ncbi:hypothetical protein F511_29441 [Dorcoceras hygrometricum]|uniref:ICln family transporter: chloride ion current inducer protein I(Cln) n=1 Tax=Dorcoceras hygrometricum TaxID=472368 RepID=A0A2Z7AHW3_9LAMI|nr:hypothetical protein F511_29441 [Dorcoceras hygrometricum]
MASSLFSNAQHVDFDSVLEMNDPGMVAMFEALMASGLRGFLGCPAVVYEDALVDFFENASVRNGVVFSTVDGQIVKISEKLFADFQVHLSEQLSESQSNISSKLYKIEQSVRDSLTDQAAVFKSLNHETRQENRTLNDVHTIHFNEFRKQVLTQNASIFVGLADVRKEVQDVNAKVDIMASRLNAIQKDAEATKEAHSHQLLEFHSQAQENHAVIHAQLSELVDYIHRGRADKKGEISGSRGPQQPAGTQISGSAVTPSFEQRVQMAQQRIVQSVINTDAANREREEAAERAERDRERRRKEAQSLKRRRRD